MFIDRGFNFFMRVCIAVLTFLMIGLLIRFSIDIYKGKSSKSEENKETNETEYVEQLDVYNGTQSSSND